MKITYVYPPLFKPFYPIGTRVMTENFVRNKRIEVAFSDMPVRTFRSNSYDRMYDEVIAVVEKKFQNGIGPFVRQNYIRYSAFYVFMSHGYFDDHIRPHIDSNYVIVTAINFCDLIIVKRLIEDNKKVVLGGPLINIGLSPAFIRKFLGEMGLNQTKLAENLIVVSGYVDIRSDFYEIISNWKDANVACSNPLSVYECETDFLQTHYGDLSGIPVHLGFNNHCWYGKCKFCTYRNLPRMSFLDGNGGDRVARCIHNLMAKFKATHIRLIDSYYRFESKVVREVLDEIKSYDITIYTGIKLLKNRRYIERLNRYVNRLLIGLESTSDFSLSYINKGYTSNDVAVAVDNIISSLDKKVSIEISLISDLPAKDVEDVERNYRTVELIRQKLTEAGFDATVHMNILSLHANMELLYAKERLLRLSENRDDFRLSSCRNYLIHILKQSGMDRPSLLPSGKTFVDKADPTADIPLGYLGSDLPVLRYDVHGDILPSDLDLIDPTRMRNILSRPVSH